ncbi:MAG TPA: LCP family protein [Ardenticatenaceae bacterium]|nr:LCP family protein [Ardenticatenaceae bacterium]
MQESPRRPARSRDPEREALKDFNRRVAQRRAPVQDVPLPRAVVRVGRRRRWRPGRGCFGCLGTLLVVLLIAALGLGLFGLIYSQALAQRGPVHVLILGIDERAQEQGPFRSDTMILAGFRPRERRVALLSIPRDLWVTIPGYGENRINTAHFWEGPALAKQTVAETFGLPVHYYVKLNFDAFVGIIDALGGIDVEVPEPLHDENYPTADYGVTTVDIPAGPQHFSGEEALIYARSRYSTSDFDRARRQQDVIAAIRRRLLEPGAWVRFPAVARVVLNSVETDMPQTEWLALAVILLRAGDVERTVIGPDYVTPFMTSAGGEVLLPRWDLINPVLMELFGY